MTGPSSLLPPQCRRVQACGSGKSYDNNKYIYLGGHDRLIRALSAGVVVKWTATADRPGLANSIPGRPIITCSVLRAVVSILRQGPFAV